MARGLPAGYAFAPAKDYASLIGIEFEQGTWRDFMRAVKAVDPELHKAIKKAAKRAADMVRDQARTKLVGQLVAGSRSKGKLVTSLRSQSLERGALVSVGKSPGLPYAAVQEFGGSVPKRGGKGVGQRTMRSDRGIGRYMSLEQRQSASDRILVKPYKGDWHSLPRAGVGYFLFPAGYEKRDEALAIFDREVREAIRNATGR